MAISPECFVCFRWGLQNWKDQSFNLTIGTEGITQLLKPNFEQSRCKWRHQCHAFAKRGTFIWTCPKTTTNHLKNISFPTTLSKNWDPVKQPPLTFWRFGRDSTPPPPAEGERGAHYDFRIKDPSYCTCNEIHIPVTQQQILS